MSRPMIVPGGRLNGPFDRDGVPLSMLTCQVMHAESATSARTLDLVTLEACTTAIGSIRAGTPFTIHWSVDQATGAMCDAIILKWARDGEVVLLLFGTTNDHHWVCLRAPEEQLVLEVA